MKCRHCQNPLTHIFVDLGTAPPSNAYLTVGDLQKQKVASAILRGVQYEACEYLPGETADSERLPGFQLNITETLASSG